MEGFEKMERVGSGSDVPKDISTQFQILSSEGIQNPNIQPSIPLPLASLSPSPFPLHNNLRPPRPLPLRPIPRKSDTSGKNKELDDAKMMRRILTSREYSQRHRQRQQQHIHDLEAKAESLQTEILEISCYKLDDSENRNASLRAENSAIEHQISVMSDELVFKEVQAEELLKERDRLTKLFKVHQIVLSEICPRIIRWPFKP